MPLSPPVEREHMHTRSIDCRGYFRQDGRWDIEATLVDTKGYPFDNRWRGRVETGQPLHEMGLRLTVDDNFVIQEIEAVTDHSPFQICPEITPRFQRLKGISIARGFSRSVKDVVGGVDGCTHLVHLLQVAATVAYQTIRPGKRHKKPAVEQPPEATGRPPILNTCHAWADDGEAVKTWYPDFFTGEGKTG